MATKPELLVTKDEMLVASTAAETDTISVTISSPAMVCSLVKEKD